VSPAAYPYPPDEFDAAAAAGPRGVHRTPRSWWSRWWPFVLAVVLFPALAYGAVTLVSDGVTLPWQDATDEPTSDQVDESEQPLDETAVETDEPTAEATEEATETPEPPAAVVDLARQVEVFNSTTTSGLASAGRDALEVAGFTAVTSGNWSGDDPEASVVYYPAAADIATAQAVATALGLSAVQESAEQAPEGIVAVLAGDFTP